MALIHPSSSESVKSELDLFSVPDTQTSIEKSQWIEYRPLSSVSEGRGPIEFLISGNGEEYTDLAETYMQITAKILKENGDELTYEDTGVGPVNLWLHSMFSQLELSLNERLVTSSNNTYAYRAYLETLLSYGPAAKRSHLTSALWYKDSYKFMDDTSANTSFGKRSVYTVASKTVCLIGRPHLDLFFQDRLILNGVDIKLKMIRNKDSFALMGVGKIVITDASLFVRKVKPSPAVQLGHIRALERTNAKYPIRRIETKVFSVPKGNFSVNQENLFLGQMPSRMVIGCVGTDAYNGDPTKNPFNFKHYGVDYLALYLDGTQVPSKPLQPDFENGLYTRSYVSLFSGTGLNNKDEGNDISYDEFGEGYTLFPFDLTPDLSTGNHFHLMKHSTLRLEIHFKQPLPETVNVVVYGEFENIIEIDKARNVIFDYSS